MEFVMMLLSFSTFLGLQQLMQCRNDDYMTLLANRPLVYFMNTVTMLLSFLELPHLIPCRNSDYLSRC